MNRFRSFAAGVECLFSLAAMPAVCGGRREIIFATVSSTAPLLSVLNGRHQRSLAVDGAKWPEQGPYHFPRQKNCWRR